MIGDGCCAFVSIHLGKGEKDKARRSVGNSVVLAVILGIVLAAIYLIFDDLLITLFGGTVSDETFRLSKEYFLYISLGIPFYMFGQAMNPVIRADGSPKMCIRDRKITVRNDDGARLPHGRTILYLALFAFSLIVVFRAVPYYWGLIIIPAVLLVADRKALRSVDYCLLLTFVCFFIFSGNMARIGAVNSFVSSLLEKDPLLVSVLSCQVIRCV